MVADEYAEFLSYPFAGRASIPDASRPWLELVAPATGRMVRSDG